jgi:hypothetical protein
MRSCSRWLSWPRETRNDLAQAHTSPGGYSDRAMFPFNNYLELNIHIN